MAGNVEERLKKILVEQLNYSLTVEQIYEATSLYGKGLGLDSLDVVSLIIRLEDEFDIIFAPAEIASSLGTFGELLKFIQQKRSQE